MSKATKVFKMITESTSDIEMIKEAVDPNLPQTMKFRGVFMVSERRNGNGRIYPYEELKKEVDRFRVEMIDTDRALMELEHPSSCEIDPTRACARILKIDEDNKSWIGEAVILCSDEKHGIKGTVCGDTLAALTNYGTKWGVSSRAMGTVDEKTGIVSDLHLVTLDAVMNPSIGEMVTADGNRFVNGILESKQWICNIHGELVESKFNALEKSLAKMPNTFDSKKRAAHIGKALTDFFNSIVE